jgi:Ribosomal protein L19
VVIARKHGERLKLDPNWATGVAQKSRISHGRDLCIATLQRRAKLYYLRDGSGKSARIAERTDSGPSETAAKE